MSYETVIEQIKETPVELLDNISYYIDFINLQHQKDTGKPESAVDNFFALADSLHLNSSGQKWTRDELHER